MPRTLLLQKRDGDGEIKIEVQDDWKLTFGPFCPPSKSGSPGNSSGTLRIYKGTKDNIIAVISDLIGFRDVTLPYMEKVAVEIGDTIWKDGQGSYKHESRVQKTYEWTQPQLEGSVIKKRKRTKK